MFGPPSVGTSGCCRERTGRLQSHPCRAARGGARPRTLAGRLGADRRGPRHAWQFSRARRRGVRRGLSNLLLVDLLARATTPGPGAPVVRDPLSGGPGDAPPAASALQPIDPHDRPLHRGGAEDLGVIPRAAHPCPCGERNQRAPERAQPLAHPVASQRPGGRGGLVVGADRRDPASDAPCSSHRERAAGAVRCRRTGRDARGDARCHRDRRGAARRARTDRRRERPRPEHSADRRRPARQRRFPVRPRAAGQRQPPEPSWDAPLRRSAPGVRAARRW